MNFVKKVFDGVNDESVHLQFQKFSRGEFPNRAAIRAKSSSGKITLNTTAEFANELVQAMAEKLGQNRTNITGAIVSTSDLKNDLEYKEIKQFQGVKRYLIDKEMSGDEILSLLERFPKTFFALTFDLPSGDSNLKIKPKAPKSGKPGKKSSDESLKPDFCKLITKDKSISEDFIFEDKNFKEANINHTFIIKDIVIPNELKDSKDFAAIREQAKRKGKIIREANIDGNVFKEEKDFLA